MRTYDLQVIKAIPIRELAVKLGIEIIGNANTGNARCFNQTAHPKGDRSPSLGFNNRTNRFKCFACNKAGSTIDLVMETQGLDFTGACEWLATQYGLAPDNTGKKQVNNNEITRVEYNNTENNTDNSEITTADIEIYRKFYDLCEHLDTTGQEFLKAKGFTPETIKQFGWRTITNEAITLIKQCINSENNSGIKGLFRAGWWLIPFYQDTDIYYLRARNPVKKEFRNLIGKDTQIYNYNALYGLTGVNSLYICEGETDTMTIAQEGLQAVGLLGATQDRTIRRLVKFITENFNRDLSVVLCFDNDQEGKTATEKTAKEFLKNGLRAKIKEIPENYKDINDYINDKEWKNGKDQKD